MACKCLEVELDGATGNPFDIKTLPGIRAELDAIESELEELQQAIEELEKPSQITDTASGAIASFPDGAAEPVIDLTCQIEPVQDLHGYDHPWPAGGGKNLIPYPYYRPDSRTHNGITYTVNADGSVTANGTATANSLYEFRHRQDTGDLALTLIPGTYTLSGCPSGGSTSSYQIIANKTQSGAVIVARDVGEGETFTVDEDTTLGVYIQIQSGTTVSNLIFKPMLAAGSEVVPYEPYANVCPISGHEGMTIKRTGKNLFKTTLTSQTVTGIAYTVNDDGSVAVSGTHTGSTIGTVVLGRADVNAGMGTVTVSGVEGVVNMVWDDVSLYDANDALLVRIMSTSSAASRSINLAAYPTCAYIKASIKRTSNGVTVSGTWKPQVEIGTANTAFEQYQNATYDISFGSAGTVYGGTLDVTTGKLTIDMRLVEYSGVSEEGWRSYSNWPNIYYVTLPARGVNGGEGISNYLNRSAGTTLGGMNDWEFICATYLNVKVESFATLADWLAYLAEHPLQVCYEIIEPTEIQLPPVAVELLKGYNNIWSDTGDTTVEYYADLKAYIDKKIAEIGG